jgi:hypothetical protein
MISTRDFYGQEFYAFCQRQYDEARNFLKNCGKPNDEIDRFLIDTNKFTACTFGRLLDNTQAIKEIQARKALANAEQEPEATRQWVGLTEFEITNCFGLVEWFDPQHDVVEFSNGEILEIAKAIEITLRKKNHDR